MKSSNYNYYNFDNTLKQFLKLPINEKYTISFIVKHIIFISQKNKNKYIIPNNIINLCRSKYSKSGYLYNELFNTGGYWSLNIKNGFSMFSIRELVKSFIVYNKLDMGNKVNHIVI